MDHDQVIPSDELELKEDEVEGIEEEKLDLSDEPSEDEIPDEDDQTYMSAIMNPNRDEEYSF